MKTKFWRCYGLAWLLVIWSGYVCAVSANGRLTDSVPVVWQGNWKNAATQEWKCGLFEHFAIYDSDFWEYKEIAPAKNKLSVRLCKDGREVSLAFRRTRKGEVEIAEEEGKFVAHQPIDKGFSPYPGADTSFFDVTYGVTDTVVLRGYYRHLDQLPEKHRRRVVEVMKNDFLTGKQMNFYADLDSLGRFEVKVPVGDLEELVVDWRFLNKKIYVCPGEQILLYAEAPELQECNSASSREAYWTAVRNVCFMGKNARLHTEFAYSPSPLNISDSYELRLLTDMQMLDSLREEWADFEGEFERYRQKYPSLSRKCVALVKMDALFRMGRTLMQNQFTIRRQGRTSFSPGYMEFVQSTFPLDCEWYYQANSSFEVFVRDYAGYWEIQGAKSLNPGVFYFESEVTNEMLFQQLKKEKGFTVEEVPEIRDFEHPGEIQERLKQAGDTVALKEFNMRMYDFLTSGSVEEVRQWMVMQAEIRRLRGLFTNSYLQELMVGREFMRTLDRTHTPLSARMLTLLEEEISNPGILERVRTENEKYRKLATKEISWLESLKNTEHLKEYGDAKELFRQLIVPYEGQVIYLDIWGTWCAPCREQMKYAGAVKEALKGEKVIFMYLANQSEEKVWKNIIREYELTGPQVVHYRLPEEQQEKIERLLQINGFPTYMLLDKAGRIVNLHAPRPQQKELLLKEIRGLLK